MSCSCIAWQLFKVVTVHRLCLSLFEENLRKLFFFFCCALESKYIALQKSRARVTCKKRGKSEKREGGGELYFKINGVDPLGLPLLQCFCHSFRGNFNSSFHFIV